MLVALISPWEGCFLEDLLPPTPLCTVVIFLDPFSSSSPKVERICYRK